MNDGNPTELTLPYIERNFKRLWNENEVGRHRWWLGTHSPNRDTSEPISTKNSTNTWKNAEKGIQNISVNTNILRILKIKSQGIQSYRV